MVERAGMIALEQGYHPITVLYFQAGGGQGLKLSVQRPGDDQPSDVSAWLLHRGDM
jgi:hypothetical protein